jgi:hypothetical protein
MMDEEHETNQCNTANKCFYLAKPFHLEVFKDLNVEVEDNEIMKMSFAADDLFTRNRDNSVILLDECSRVLCHQQLVQ